MATVELKNSRIDDRSDDIAEAATHRAAVRQVQATLAASATTNSADHVDRQKAKEALTKKIPS